MGHGAGSNFLNFLNFLNFRGIRNSRKFAVRDWCVFLAGIAHNGCQSIGTVWEA
jgi:hypothetical protein